AVALPTGSLSANGYQNDYTGIGAAGSCDASGMPGKLEVVVTLVVRWFLSLEAAAFGAAVLVHSGVLAHGYEHRKAATAESVIGLVLLVGLASSVIAPRSSRSIGLAVQAF